MQKTSFLLILLFVFISTAAVKARASSWMDPTLAAFLNENNARSIARVILLFDTPTGISYPRKNHPSEVVSFLQGISTKALQQAKSELGANIAQDIRFVRLNWINDSATFDVTPQGLKRLQTLSNVKKIYSNSEVKMGAPVRTRLTSEKPSQAVPYDFEMMSLSQLIRERPDLDGRGVLLGSLDTGVEGSHPALQGKIERFFDLYTLKAGTSYDTEHHGTHTTGTMVGGNRSNLQFGIAPGAKVIMAGGKTLHHDSMLVGMQYMLDPDGDKSVAHVPHVINNSWAIGPQADRESYYRAISAWDAAGILPVFSAGNDGPDPETITHPHEHPAAFVVGALGMDGKLMEFSSRGPAIYNGKSVQKPELVSPGEGILSCISKNDYAYMDGTSMAAPHVTGLVGLMLQANPKLNSSQIRDILAHSTDRKAWDPGYGYGKLNARAAVMKALELFQMERGAGFVPNYSDSLLISPEKVELLGYARNSFEITASSIFDYPEN